MKKLLSILALVAVVVAFWSGCSGQSKLNKEQEKVSSQYANSDFQIISMGPEGVLPAEVKHPQIYVHFSQPVVPLQKLGTQTDQSDIMTITPSIEGVFRWYGTGFLSFESSEEALPQQEYRISIKKDLESLTGKKLSGTNEFSFKTEELKLLSIIPGYEDRKEGFYVKVDDIPTKSAKDIAMYFSYDVNPEVIKNYISVTSSDGKIFTFTTTPLEEKSIKIVLNEEPEQNSEITVTLKKGAKSEDGYLGTSKKQTEKFHTLKPFEIKRVQSKRSYSNYSYPVEINFSHPLMENSEEVISESLSTIPEMEITKENITIRGSRAILHGLPVTFEQTYTLNIKTNIKDTYGRELIDEVETEITVPPATSFVYFKNSGFKILESQFEPKIAFEYQNILPGSWYQVNSISQIGIIGDTKSEKINYDPTNIPKNTRIVETVNLSPFLSKTSDIFSGAVKFSAEIDYTSKYRNTMRNYTRENNQFLQVTDLGITTRYSYNKIITLVTSLKTGKPIEGAKIAIYNFPRETRTLTEEALSEKILSATPDTALLFSETDKDGVAVIELEDNQYRTLFGSGTLYIEAKTEDDRVIFAPNENSWYRTYNAAYYAGTYTSNTIFAAENTTMNTFIFTDRGLYKPGETITFRGIDRNLKKGSYSPYAGEYKIKFTSSGWKPVVYDETEGSTSNSGTFWGKWTIPENFKPGSYAIEYTRETDGKMHTERKTFSVQFFQRLRFEASASIEDLTYIRGDELQGEIKASFLGGGSLADCSYTTWWSRVPKWYKPTGEEYKNYRFGPMYSYDGSTTAGKGKGALSGDGIAFVSQKSGGEKLKGTAYSYRLEARITDQGNQMITANASALVHPASYYIGVSKIKNKSGFPKKGDTLEYDYILAPVDKTDTQISGKSKEMKIELLREEWKQVQQVGWNGDIFSRYEKEMIAEEEKTISLDKTGSFSVTPPKGGAYILRLSAADSKGNEVITETRFYATSSDWIWYGRDNAEEIEFVADKTIYNVGETASILLQSPIPKGKYLFTIEREGIFSEKIINLESSTSVLEIPIEEKYLPIVYVTLSSYSIRTKEPDHDFSTPDLDKPKGIFGATALHVNTDLVAFDIKIETDKSFYRPGEEAKISVTATHKGMPVPEAEITIMAVDRGVIDLINYHVPNPVDFFYNPKNFPSCVEGNDSRSLLIDPVTYEVRNLFGGDAGGSKMKQRKNFDATAYFNPSIITDAQGQASCTFTLPDSLTAYRITAVGVKINSFAIQEGEIGVQNPLSVRDVMPSRLRVTDKAEAGVIISNLDMEAHTVTVSLKTYDGIERTGEPTSKNGIIRAAGSGIVNGETEKSITVEPGKTEPLMFEVEALKEGFITLEYTVKSNILNEQLIKPIQIESSYSWETVTTSGEVRSEKEGGKATAEEFIVFPSEIDNTKGEFFLQLDPTRIGVLREAVRYVFNYPYGCLEQRAARLLPLVIFKNYISVFGLESKISDTDDVIKEELLNWAEYQKGDGGFPYWSDGRDSSYGVSLRLGEIIAIAIENEIPIPVSESGKQINIEKLKKYIDQIISNTKSINRAYPNYVRQLLGSTVSNDDIDKIVKNEDSSISDLAFSALTFLEKGEWEKAEEVADIIKNYMTFTTRGVDITAKSEGGMSWFFFSDDSERFALTLHLFSKLDPNNDINTRLMYELMEKQKAGNGYWQNTASTAQVLMAISVYIKENKLENTDFTATAFLDNKEFLSGSFKGVTAPIIKKQVTLAEGIPGSALRNKNIPLEITKEGKGRLFYTTSMKYPIPPIEQVPRDEGISIFMELTDIETGKKIEGNILKAGGIYKAKVFVSSVRDRTFLALQAPIPSGGEIMNAAFATSATFGEFDKDDESENNYGYGISNQVIYDNEIRYFWNRFPKGVQQVDFIFRAVRKGEYPTPAAFAECMYQPEIFGRGAGKVFIID